MSKYTVQLRFPVEQFLTDKSKENTESNWQYIYSDLGLDDYPIFDETYRDTLNRKIIRHFYMREIGQETFGQFKFILRRTMFEIMPYYNKLYNSELLTISDPLSNKGRLYSETYTGAASGSNRHTGTDSTDVDTTTDVDGTTTDNGRNVFQDTPMNLLSNGSSSPSIQNMDYATNVTYASNTNNVDQTNTVDGTTTTTYNTTNATSENTSGARNITETGYSKSKSELLQEYRDTFLNIDMKVIKDLEPCFFGLW